MKNKNIKLWSWEKKPRTMRRFINPGDIFCVNLNDGYFKKNLNLECDHFAFGRILTKLKIGTMIEFFDYFSPKPEMTLGLLESVQRLKYPWLNINDEIIKVNIYALFDRKTEADWRIIGQDKEYIHTKDNDKFFIYGAESESLHDIHGKNVEVKRNMDFSVYAKPGIRGDDAISLFCFTDALKSRLKDMSDNQETGTA